MKHCGLFVFLWSWKGFMLLHSRSAELSKRWLYTQVEHTADATQLLRVSGHFDLDCIVLQKLFFSMLLMLLKCQKA